MSAASDLREAIDQAIQDNYESTAWYVGEGTTNGILDAVIAALPTIDNEIETVFVQGEKLMLERVIDLLQSAKTQKGEE